MCSPLCAAPFLQHICSIRGYGVHGDVRRRYEVLLILTTDSRPLNGTLRFGRLMGAVTLILSVRVGMYSSTEASPLLVFLTLMEAHTHPGLSGASVILPDVSQVIWFLAAGLVKANGMLAEPDVCTSSRLVLAVYRRNSNSRTCAIYQLDF